MAELKTNLAGVKMGNPTVLASGYLGVSADILIRVANSGAGAVTMKSIGPIPKEGHDNPTVIANEKYMINAVGLPSPGYKNIDYEWDDLKKLKKPLFASIYGYSEKDFKELAKDISDRDPDLIEVNLSCPNIKKGGMQFSFNPKVAAKITKIVKDYSSGIPVFPKLSPNTPNIVDIAKACVKSGADGITAINTVGPAMAIDINTHKPVLANKMGGLSGPAIKPVSICCVYRIYKDLQVPIIGTGGLVSGEDCIEMLQAGATGLGIGYATYVYGINAFDVICKEMKSWMKKHKIKNVKKLVGIAHE